MFTRVLVLVILFSQLGLGDAYAGRFDRLGKSMTRAGLSLGKDLVSGAADLNSNQMFIQRRTFIPVGRPPRPPRLPAEKHGNHSNGSNPWGWGVAAAGVGGAAFLTYEMTKHGQGMTKKFLDENDGLDSELFEIAEELESAMEQDFSSDEEALRNLRQNIVSLKQIYCSEDSPLESRGEAIHLLYQFKNNRQFVENLKAANALESQYEMVSDLDPRIICQN